MPDVNLPGPCIRELWRIQLHDMINIDRIFFVISELQEKSNQMYRPYVEVSRNCCRQIKKGYERICSPQYYLSFTNGDEGNKPQLEERVVVQMDTESPIIYQKTCLDHCFDKPLQLTLRDLDKVGKNGRSICVPAFCLELLFGPANAKQPLRIPSEDDAEFDNLF
ncbi:phosphatidylinositol 3,4,5-trisphosphate 3-phosphatase and protein-tyrosine-phosphatase PTEN1-like [Juglans regia]|uniref:Phosphatidylinositol 3,4,5-trisphosphate 3-phosphatase and protein-tyrosine-phosphatase PTEN1-like n=1 Tax=Juglans regia TaxID=51240 RepID=A0A6P9EPS1_JUGRE|nr:phosphatidylinositol 3,4,5-trisphosphate 3-phosphatase and protein-tyrosine-phosphatase PTEN1-like [Juglans regia]